MNIFELTIYFLEHGGHILQVVMIQKPNRFILFIFIKRYCEQFWSKESEHIKFITQVSHKPAKLFDTSRTPLFRRPPRRTPTTRFWLPILLMRVKWSTTLSKTRGWTTTFLTGFSVEGILWRRKSYYKVETVWKCRNWVCISRMMLRNLLWKTGSKKSIHNFCQRWDRSKMVCTL